MINGLKTGGTNGEQKYDYQTPNPKMNPVIYRGISRIQKKTKTEHYTTNNHI